MRMHTPPENQGYIVEVSYGWSGGALYKRVHDGSDGSTQWYVASDEAQVKAYADSGIGQPMALCLNLDAMR